MLRRYKILIIITTRSNHSPGGEGGKLPYIKGGDARRKISNEPLKGINLGVG